MRGKILFIIFLVSSLIVTGTVDLESLTVNQWREDINYLARELVRCHPNLFFKIGEQDFKRAVADLDREAETLTWQEIYTRMTELVASIGDGHTAIAPVEKLESYPVYPYWFKDGLYIIATDRVNVDLLNTRVIEVGGCTIDEVVGTLRPVISQDNYWGFLGAFPNYFTRPEIMSSLGLAKKNGELTLTLEKDGKIFETTVTPLEYGIDWIQKRADREYEASGNDNYWYEYFPQSQVLQFHYDSAQRQEGKPFFFFVCELFSFVRKNPVEKLVLDMRYNSGGNSLLLEPFMLRVMFDCRFNKKGKLFVVIGRETFSSAVLNAISMKKRTNAIFVGEPTGGSPRHYGAPKRFTLPNSQLPVSCSTIFWKTSEDTSQAFMPDILCERTFQEYYWMIDPAMELIKSFEGR